MKKKKKENELVPHDSTEWDTWKKLYSGRMNK